MQPESELDMKGEDLSLMSVKLEDELLLHQCRAEFDVHTFPMKTGMFILVLTLILDPGVF